MRFVLLMLCVSGIALQPLTASAAEVTKAQIDAGRELAFSKAKGNCLACHKMPSDPAAVTSATFGPPLVNMKARFPDRDKLRAQIWDATRNNPDTVMPPFGRNHILTDKEIDLITDYVETL